MFLQEDFTMLRLAYFCREHKCTKVVYTGVTQGQMTYFSEQKFGIDAPNIHTIIDFLRTLQCHNHLFLNVFFYITFAEVIQLAYESSKLKIHALHKYVLGAN